ncbi:hypothetical protein [Amycolatopsis sp. WQ 127309]|uniref:effector-associated constant component EACC1 n=1 Tax=Amycolatopsis sp. WQ 127309 TaxID=2932773 RepID=UPI001FF47819|nr:hypothetical protein [Amycolatopsis sp. WQ 127309]UOZ08319.1 hypothetical protein MUY22_08595 [Amycolatopsis sp. WQ 127309]
MPTFSLKVREPDPAERDRLHRQLRAELLALDVTAADFASATEPPPGAKGDASAITAIVVSLAGSPVLIQLVGLLRDWVRRGTDRTIRIVDGDRALEITSATARDNREAIEGFFALDEGKPAKDE